MALGSRPLHQPLLAAEVGEWLWAAAALMLVFEGLLPLLSPSTWRTVFQRALAMTDGQIRFVGLLSVSLGLLCLLLKAL